VRLVLAAVLGTWGRRSAGLRFLNGSMGVRGGMGYLILKHV
jgi:hypothetical protein